MCRGGGHTGHTVVVSSAITSDDDVVVPPQLTVLVILIAVEATIEVVYALLQPQYGPGGRVLFASSLAAKVFLAIGTRRLIASAAIILLFLQTIGLLVALSAPWAIPIRLALVAMIVITYVLIGSSLHAFPTPELPDT